MCENLETICGSLGEEKEGGKGRRREGKELFSFKKKLLVGVKRRGGQQHSLTGA